MIYQINVNHPFCRDYGNLNEVLYFSLNNMVYSIYRGQIVRSAWIIDRFNELVHNKILIYHSELDDRLLQEL